MKTNNRRIRNRRAGFTMIEVLVAAAPGLGLDTARVLAAHGARVVLAVRDIGKGAAAAAKIGGDVAVHYWGKARAEAAMPFNTLEKMGVKFSLNHDAPILPKPDVMALVDAAVNRTSASGQVIGPEERASPYLALEGVTSYAAYQIKEEKAKGTLEEGKLADLVILEQNPLKVEPKVIKDILAEVVAKGKGAGPEAKVGTAYYNYGVQMGAQVTLQFDKMAARPAAAESAHEHHQRVGAEQARYQWNMFLLGLVLLAIVSRH